MIPLKFIFYIFSSFIVSCLCQRGEREFSYSLDNARLYTKEIGENGPTFVVGSKYYQVVPNTNENTTMICKRRERNDFRTVYKTSIRMKNSTGKTNKLTQALYDKYFAVIVREVWNCATGKQIFISRIFNLATSIRFKFQCELILKQKDGFIKLMRKTVGADEKIPDWVKTYRNEERKKGNEFTEVTYTNPGALQNIFDAQLPIKMELISTIPSEILGVKESIAICKKQQDIGTFLFDYRPKLNITDKTSQKTITITQENYLDYITPIKDELWICKDEKAYRFLRIVNELQGLKQLQQVEYYDSIQLYSRTLNVRKTSVNVIEIKYLDHNTFATLKYGFNNFILSVSSCELLEDFPINKFKKYYRTECTYLPKDKANLDSEKTLCFDTYFNLIDWEVWSCKNNKNKILFRRIVNHFELKTWEGTSTLQPIKDIRHYDGVFVGFGKYAHGVDGWTFKQIKYMSVDDSPLIYKYDGKLTLKENIIQARPLNELLDTNTKSCLFNVATRSMSYLLDHDKMAYRTTVKSSGVILKIDSRYEKVASNDTLICKQESKTEPSYGMRVFLANRANDILFEFDKGLSATFMSTLSLSWKCSLLEDGEEGDVKLIRVINRLEVGEDRLAHVIHNDGVTVIKGESVIEELKFIDPSDGKITKYDGSLVFVPGPHEFESIQCDLSSNLADNKPGDYLPEVLIPLKNDQLWYFSKMNKTQLESMFKVLTRNAIPCESSQYGNVTRIVNTVETNADLAEIYYTDGVTIWKNDTDGTITLREVKYMDPTTKEIVKFDGVVDYVNHKSIDKFAEGTSVEDDR
ncbi:hypothetical protein LSTR_LSTR009383 [Laodelphax striatellus]|uniref:Vitellogenin domain-containing protein n=1 Tax=Laodelphax striatellus TaxID=195883 RepID=A0A482XME0_LAOST|nr:hypothetical protein LSTR_LSTR009383 [Laodelphax striatellus]